MADINRLAAQYAEQNLASNPFNALFQGGRRMVNKLREQLRADAARDRGMTFEQLMERDYLSRMDRPQTWQDSLAVASLVPAPIVSDVAGAASDALMYWNDPESRNPVNYGMSLAGLVPGVPAASVMIKGKAQRAARPVMSMGDTSANSRGYDQAKIATQYPDVAPPVPAVDKKTGKEFLAKNLSDEARAVEKARKAAQKDIEKGNYTPYFPVAERYYADPSKYDIRGNTLTDAIPKKQSTIDKYDARFNTPEARARLSEAYDRAASDELAKDWYAMGQLEAEFIKEYGETEGRRLFKEAFADAMAATTGGADPTANMLMAHYGNYLRATDQQLPTAAYDFPYPIGGRFASGNMAMYDKVINDGQGLSAAETPKRFNFAADFLGDRSRATIDEQMSGGFEPGLLAPPNNSYGVMERVIGELAAEKGVMPANFQDVAWAGLKGTSGKPMIQHINEAIERTARVTGKTPEQVVRDSFIRRTAPLYGLAGAGLLGAGLYSGGAEDESM